MNHCSCTILLTTQPFQYKIAESPIPSAEEESSSEDEEDGPRKPKVDPDDPVARKSKSKNILTTIADHSLRNGN